MSESVLKGACVIGQSGGPTAVINASAYGAIRAALDSESITKVYGAANGIKGVLEDKLYLMEEEDAAELELLKYTPSSALGSSRYKLADPDEDDIDFRRILEVFKKYDIRYFFYNGGNDSMDTCNKISKYMLKAGYEIRIMGIPKTVDNDLFGTDHCPGFGSAAKYLATSFMEVCLDSRVYDTGMITIVECMGRNAGWLTASSALACEMVQGPDLIYLPERAFDMDRFLSDVNKVYASEGKCLIAVSEGIKYEDGSYVSMAKASSTDGFGHQQLGGLAGLLAAHISKWMGVKVRGIEPSLLQRCAAHVASMTDIEESILAGKTAVEEAVKGVTDKMVGFECRRDNGYSCKIGMFELASAANYEKKIPDSWINSEGNGVFRPFFDYAMPLIQGETAMPKENGLPRFARLKKVLAG